jgi:fluoride exporter
MDGAYRVLWVCLGGGVGSGARYLLSLWATQRFEVSVPIGTLLVNASGSLLLGVLMSLALDTSMLPPSVRLGLTVGVMGGFTTYSTFNYETLRLAEQGLWGTAAAYVGLTLVGSWILGALGFFVTRWLVTSP